MKARPCFVAALLAVLFLPMVAHAQEFGARSVTRTLATDISVTDFAAKTLIKSTPVAVDRYSQLSVRVTFAASDTDSVALVVYAVGAPSTTALADNFGALFDARPDTVGAQGWLVAGNANYNAGDVLIQTNGTVSFGVGGGIVSTQVTIPIADSRGTRPRFTFLSLWVLNRTNTQIDDVTVEIIAGSN